MSDKRVNFLLIDLECTCNDDPPLPREEMEIIEIGAVVVSLTGNALELMEDQQIYVQPQWNKSLTPFCTNLTGIQQQQLDQALPLEESIKLLDSWIIKNNVTAWGSWGKFDQRHFSSETKLKNLRNPFDSYQHINIKQLFARKRGHKVGLARAVQISGLEFQGRHHSGLDDARNIAQLLDNDELLREAVITRV